MKIRYIFLAPPIVIVLSLSLLYCYYLSRNKVKLGEITWQYLGSEKCASVIKKNGKIIFGPHYITLWAEYPYIFGEYILPGASVYYVVDIRTKKSRFFKDFQKIREQYSVDFDPRDFVTFQDVRGQWAKPYKLKALRESIKKPFCQKD
jgi:hypothetical protein